MKRSSRILLITTSLLCAGSLRAQGSAAEIPYDSTPNLLKLPDRLYLGEAVGVATNSKGHIFVYTRAGSTNAAIGASRTFTHGGARLFEFGPDGRYIREIGQGLYGFMFAHVVRVDRQDNIWAVDEGSSVLIKFNPEGRVIMTMGRKPEAVTVPEPHGPAPRGGAGVAGDNFNRPTDVAWDAAGNIFVSDGYGNSRVAKFDKNGRFLKSWGSRGTEPSQFNTPHSIAVDAQGNVYVGDRGNKRIQVFDNDGNFKTQYTHVGAPWAVCITPGPHQYLYSSNSNGTASMDNGEIYKMELDGKVLGKFGKAGKLLKEFGSVHEIDCRNPNELYVGEITNWRVQKLTLHP
jgi:NHL repeat-containing protein